MPPDRPAVSALGRRPVVNPYTHGLARGDNRTMHYREFLAAPVAHHAPRVILDGLTIDLAERRAPGAPHSIAEIVAHLAFWQDWFHDRMQGRAASMPTAAAIGWPAVEPGTWPALRDRFLSGLEQGRDRRGPRADGQADHPAPGVPAPRALHGR